MPLNEPGFAKDRLLVRYLYILAIASFFLSLFVSTVGEEGVYTISSYEMRYHHHYLYPTTYGDVYWRPPLYNWLIIVFSNLLGWKHVLIAARLVTALATIATSFVLLWLGNCLFKTAYFGLFAALIYLTSDALFYHGWLAYSDPLFAFFVVTAIALLWVANIEQRHSYVWLSVAALVAAFMTKALTAYVFYIIAFFFIVYGNGKFKSFLLRPVNFIPYLIAIVFYFFWNSVSHKTTQTGMWLDIFRKFYKVNWNQYIQQIIVFPIETFCRFLPASGLVIYYFIKRKFEKIRFNPYLIRTLLALSVFNVIPYWFSPHSNIRYLLPLYPFIALLLAIMLWHLPKKHLKTVICWLTLAILLKYAELPLIYYYQYYYRGNYAQVAQQILLKTKGFPIYSNDSVATGLSVAAEIDKLIYPRPPLQHIRLATEKDLFVMSDKIDPKLGKLYHVFQLGKQKTLLYVLCRGKACDVH